MRITKKKGSRRRSSTPLKINGWNIIMEVWKIIFLFKWVICRFHVNLPGCSSGGGGSLWICLVFEILSLQVIPIRVTRCTSVYDATALKHPCVRLIE